MTGEEAFRAAILPWVQQQRRGVVEVQQVVSSGWEAGGTEEGFYDQADTDIDFIVEEDGERLKQTMSLSGSEMADLWNWVVTNYPAATT